MTEGLTRPMPDPVAAAHPGRFDVRDFARTAVGSHRSDIDLDAFDARPLEPGTVESLRYLRELERATMSHLRNLLVTPTHKDARVTAFLVTWAFEKFWIADALEIIVARHDAATRGEEAASSDEEGQHDAGIVVRPRLAARIAERFRPIYGSFVTGAIGFDIVAVHLALGTIDEWLTQAAYAEVIDKDPHPELVPLFATIATIKERHLAFFEQETRLRLADSRTSQRLARRNVARSEWPIGAGLLSRESTSGFYRRLIPGETAAQIDARIDTIPGLGGLSLISRARTKRLDDTLPARGLGHRIGRTAATLAHGVKR